MRTDGLRLRTALFVFLCSFVSVAGTADAQAPSPTASSGREGDLVQVQPDDEQRMRHWLRVRGDGGRGRAFTIAVGFAVPAMLGGYGAYHLAGDRDPLLGRVTLGLGILSLAGPIAALVLPDYPQLDSENLPERPLTEREIGRFEGMLQSEARRGRSLRIAGGISGGLHLVAGSLALGLSLRSGENFLDSPAELGAYTGIMLGGVLNLISSFFRSKSEKIWDGYRSGEIQVESARVRFSGDHLSVTF